MDLDITVYEGDPVKPVVIFIHGLGMDKNFWVNPLETKVFARNIPMKILAASRPAPCPVQKRRGITVGNIPHRVNSLWFALRKKEYNLVCWSQRRPVGPIGVAVEELREIVKRTIRHFPFKSIALIGHSRGGLVARKFMEKKPPEIKALITISSPHKGSSLSRLGKYLSPVSRVLKRVLPKYTYGTVSEVIERMHDLLEGDALKELLPGSDFFLKLKDSPSSRTKYVSFGGTKTRLLNVYKWTRQDLKMYPRTLLTIPDSLIRILPASVVPPELVPGKGDFMVTTESSVLPWASLHNNLPANHISIIWNRKVISGILELLDGI